MTSTRTAIQPLVCLAFLFLFFAATGPMAAEEGAHPAPAMISAEQLELHGELYGQPFWARILKADQQFGGHRVMKLVYIPPKPEDIGGTHLVDHPYILLDRQARIIAWNERGQGLSAVEYRQRGYAVLHERSELHDGHLAPVQKRFNLSHPEPTWDAHLAPILLALTWRPDLPRTRIPAAAFFSEADSIPLHRVRIDGANIILPGNLSLRAEADTQGRLARLVDENDQVIFSVSTWLSDSPASAESDSE
ncbi:MAG: hypothetical protein EA402_13260 [Planctomycetota bacterium]|nr:MAG: hypothetical protein EA402_13260 [Planctomycetota bacterium]